MTHCITGLIFVNSQIELFPSTLFKLRLLEVRSRTVVLMNLNDKKTVFFKTLALEQDLSLENGYKSNDIDFEVEIPITVQKSESQTCMLKPGRKYPELLPGMRKENFSK